MGRLFQPLLWALLGAGLAGGVFFVVHRPPAAQLTIVVSTPTPAGVATPSGKIDINNAPAEVLETLPGIGPVKARAIVEYREQNGPFRRVDELMKVKGIGEATYRALRELVTVGPEP